MSSLYILNISPLLNLELAKIFYKSVGSFCLIDSVFSLTEALQFYEVRFVILDLTAQAIAVLFRNFPPVPISSRLFPTFSSISFSITGCMWSSLIHLDLTLVQGDKNGSIQPGMVVHAFNPSTREAEAGGFLSSRPAWSTK